ncbi:MAG: peptidylprolyl isomerase, partial [Paracoccaceae bacterium]
MNIKTLIRTSLIALGLTLAPLAVAAQNLFSAAILVNDQAITNYELKQRTMFLEALRFPGVPDELAPKQLIEERLKKAAADQLGIRVSEEELQFELESFAQRFNVAFDEFAAELERVGISVDTPREFIANQLLWREVVRARFGAQANVDEAQVERSANAEKSGSSIEVLLTEIIMAMQPGQEQEVRERARELSKIRSFDAFSDAAREFSDAPTREFGGRVTWQKLDTLPGVLQPLIFGLAPGEVTDPLSIPNALALFQLRGIRETAYRRPLPESVDYLRYALPSSELENINSIRANINHCDDLYGWAKGNPNHVLKRKTVKRAEIDGPTRNILTNLDENEYVIATQEPTTTLIMMCSRSQILDLEEQDLAQIRDGLLNQRLGSYADSYLENLRD